MTRKLKSLGLALLALGAIGALAAGSASAAGERFHSEEETTIVTGENAGNFVISSGGLQTTCKSVTLKGTMKGENGTTTTKTLTLHPTFSKCEDNVFGGTDEVDTTGCNFIISSERPGEHLPLSIECTTGFVIKNTATGCTLDFAAQTATNGVAITNEGAGSTRDIRIKFTAGVTYTKTEGGLCFLISGSSASVSATFTLKGFRDNGVTGPIDEVLETKDETAVYNEGPQVGIWWE